MTRKRKIQLAVIATLVLIVLAFVITGDIEKKVSVDEAADHCDSWLPILEEVIRFQPAN